MPIYRWLTWMLQEQSLERGSGRGDAVALQRIQGRAAFGERGCASSSRSGAAS
jgi:hypothetical protein